MQPFHNAHIEQAESYCCFRQLRLLKGCIKSLPFEAARAAVAAFVTSQVDRCNSLLVGAPKRLLDCLQSVLNAAARLQCNRRKYDHITPLLRDVLHWLPVPLRVEFKIYLLVYKSLHGAAPGYLREYCKEDAFIRFGVKASIDGQMRSSRKTDEDSVWRPRLLSCWPQMLEQTSCCSAYSRLALILLKLDLDRKSTRLNSS